MSLIRQSDTPTRYASLSRFTEPTAPLGQASVESKGFTLKNEAWDMSLLGNHYSYER